MKLPYIFKSLSEAEFAAIWLHHEVEKIRHTYGYISLGELYEKANIIMMCNHKINFTDYACGWTWEEDLRIVPYCEPHWGYSVYGLELTEPKLI